MSALRVPNTQPIQYTMKIDGVAFTALEDLKSAVVRLPAGSKLVWDSGCFWFRDIPLGAQPRMTMSSFKQFCQEHQIEFNYYFGY